MPEVEVSIENQIREFIKENFLFGGDDSHLKADDSFLDNGIIDSTGVLELVAFVEQNFNIEVNDEELLPENLDSIRNLTLFINQKLDDILFYQRH